MRYTHYIPVSILLIALFITGCGPSEEEQQRREQARQDSIEQARQDSLQRIRQQRQDSLERAATDSASQSQPDQMNIAFSENGAFSVQVESWRSQKKAENQAQLWRDRGFNQAYMVRYGNESTGDIWYRVRLGKVDSQDYANKIQQQIQQEYQAESWTGNAN